jgi:hypothetical protein
MGSERVLFPLIASPSREELRSEGVCFRMRPSDQGRAARARRGRPVRGAARPGARMLPDTGVLAHPLKAQQQRLSTAGATGLRERGRPETRHPGEEERRVRLARSHFPSTADFLPVLAFRAVLPRASGKGGPRAATRAAPRIQLPTASLLRARMRLVVHSGAGRRI